MRKIPKSKTRTIIAVAACLLVPAPLSGLSTWELATTPPSPTQGICAGISPHASSYAASGLSCGRYPFDAATADGLCPNCRVNASQDSDGGKLSRIRKLYSRDFFMLGKDGKEPGARRLQRGYAMRSELQWAQRDGEIPYHWQLYLGSCARSENSGEENDTTTLPIPPTAWLITSGIICMVGLTRRS